MTTKVLAVATVLLVHTAAAHAQQSPPAAAGQGAADYPPPYAPPPGFVPPGGQAAPPPSRAPTYYGPPGYGQPGGYSYPPNYYQPSYAPPPPRQITHRPFTLGGGIGFGGLAFKDNLGNRESAWGMGYTFRLGFGLRPGLMLMWDLEGSLINEGTGGDLADGEPRGVAAVRHAATVRQGRLRVRAGRDRRQPFRSGAAPRWVASATRSFRAGTGHSPSKPPSPARATTTPTPAETWNNWSLVNFVINFF